MMNESSRAFVALLTDTFSAGNGIFPCLVPCEAVPHRASTFPTWMINPTLKLREPFRLTPAIAESLDTMKATHWSGNRFAAPTTLSCFQVASCWISFANFRLGITFRGAINLRLVTRTISRLAAYKTDTFLRLAPSVLKIAFRRAKPRLLICVPRMKIIATLKASCCDTIHSAIFTPHTIIIPQINEAYLKIAIERLRQEVLL